VQQVHAIGGAQGLRPGQAFDRGHQGRRRRVTQSGSHARVICATRRMVPGSQWS